MEGLKVLDLRTQERPPAAGPGHPAEPELTLFMRRELTPRGVCRIVRHLLTGCPACLRVTRRLWDLGDLAPRAGERW